MTESKITAAGQTTIPTVIRRHLQLETGDKVRYFIEGDRVLIVPARKSVKRLKGRLPPPARRLSIEEMDDAIAAGVRGGTQPE